MHGHSVQIYHGARLQWPLTDECVESHVHVVCCLRLLLFADVIRRDVIFIEELLRDIRSLALPLKHFISIGG